VRRIVDECTDVDDRDAVGILKPAAAIGKPGWDSRFESDCSSGESSERRSSERVAIN